MLKMPKIKGTKMTNGVFYKLNISLEHVHTISIENGTKSSYVKREGSFERKI